MSDSPQESRKRHLSKIRPHGLAFMRVYWRLFTFNGVYFRAPSDRGPERHRRHRRAPAGDKQHKPHRPRIVSSDDPAAPWGDLSQANAFTSSPAKSWQARLPYCRSPWRRRTDSVPSRASSDDRGQLRRSRCGELLGKMIFPPRIVQASTQGNSQKSGLPDAPFKSYAATAFFSRLRRYLAKAKLAKPVNNSVQVDGSGIVDRGEFPMPGLTIIEYSPALGSVKGMKK
jgi:hypothetical protein